MIKKIIKIKNFGKFKSPTFGKEYWNGQFEQTNVIYANNGSGKTTLSLLFRSLSGNNELISKKQTFGTKEPTEIELLDFNNKTFKFQKGKWNKFQDKLEIFDSFYSEDNVYIITLKDGKSPNIFEILLGEESVKIKKDMDLLKDDLKKLKTTRTSLRGRRSHAESTEKKTHYQDLMDQNLVDRKKIIDEIEKAEGKLVSLSAEHRDAYLLKINQFLRLFNPNLKLSKLTQYRQKVVYTLHVSEHSLRPDDKSRYSLKYSLSEGDKNALSLSFFLAKIELLPDLSEYTILIDDPISSFDYGRKSTTINNLIGLSKKVKMFILLTHDLTFANDFSRRMNYSCNNLKIEFNGTTSYFTKHDIEKESMTGVFKDLTVLHEFLQYGANSDTERRDVARCIRPVLEGIFRIKFFREVERTEWLGDIIGKIRNADPSSIYYPFQKILPELSEINDYSKEYHHSNPYYLETPINDEELRNYVQRTIEILRVL